MSNGNSLRGASPWSFERPPPAERLLRATPEKAADLVQSISAHGIYLIDRAGLIQSWNRGAESITGFGRAEVLGRPFEMLFPEDAIREGVPRRTLEFVRAHHHCKDEQRRRLRNGGEYLAQCALDAVRGDLGELLGFVEVVQDITEAKQREDRLYQRATRDALTGLHNRGHFIEMALLEIERARRFAEPLSLVILDVDQFDKLQATHGHEIADRVLVALARCCTGTARRIDLAGRLEDGRFALLLPRADKQPATEMALRLRRAIGAQRVAIGGGRDIGFTVSMGLASLRRTTRDLAELMRNADTALEQARRAGRHQLEVWFE